MKVWCVEHRAGWCAVKGNIPYAKESTNVPTECYPFVIMSYGITQREPTCKICREKLNLPPIEKG